MSKKVSASTMFLLTALLLAAFGAGESQGVNREGKLTDCFEPGSAEVSEIIPAPPRALGNARNAESACDAWHELALERAREQLIKENLRPGDELLRAFESKDRGLEAERLYLLYLIAKTENSLDEMARLNTALQAKAPGTPYALLVSGIEECIHGDCASVVPQLEEANRSIDTDMARAYLAAAYAYSGRFTDAEAIFDQIRAGAPGFDEAIIYVAVATYLKASRPEDARSIGQGYIEAHPELEGSFLRKQTRKLLEGIDSR